MSGLNDKKLIKSKPTRKLKPANSILEYFEYFCQMSSKSINVLMSYTVSKLVRFFETQCRYKKLASDSAYLCHRTQRWQGRGRVKVQDKCQMRKVMCHQAPQPAALHHRYWWRVVLPLPILPSFSEPVNSYRYCKFTQSIISNVPIGALQHGPCATYPTQNFGWVGHNAFGPTNNWPVCSLILAVVN